MLPSRDRRQWRSESAGLSSRRNYKMLLVRVMAPDGCSRANIGKFWFWGGGGGGFMIN